MISDKRELKLCGNATIVNDGGSNFIHSRLKSKPTKMSIKNSIEVSPIHDLLRGEFDDLIDFNETYKSSILEKHENNYDSPLEVMDEIERDYENPSIPNSRIILGFEKGLIDHINGALYLTSDGWNDARGDIVGLSDASLDQIREYVSNKANIIPEVSIQDLEHAESVGELFIEGVLYANKSEGRWTDVKTLRKFDEGSLVRLLHHRNEKVVIFGSHVENKFYHGVVTEHNKPFEKFRLRKGSSIQGDGHYATTSLNEAVKVYANPKSFEISGKLLGMRDKGLDTSGYKFGHVYESTTKANIYRASINKTIHSFTEVPSLHSFMAIAHGNDTSIGLANNLWMSMKSGPTTYDVYTKINELNKDAIRSNKPGDLIEKIIGSLGFEAIEIVHPKKELAVFRKKITELEDISEEDFLSAKLRKTNIINQCVNYIEGLEQSISAKADGSHLILYNLDKLESKYLTLLPLNKEILGKKDFFYSSDEKVTIESILEKKKDVTINPTL